MKQFDCCRSNWARLFSLWPLGEGLIGFVLISFSFHACAGNPVGESARYQQVWSPRNVEFVLVNGVSTPRVDPGIFEAEIRDSLSALANSIGLSFSFVPAGSPCSDGAVTARIVITVPAGALSVANRAGGTGKTAAIPVRVESLDDCGYRSDAFTRSLVFDVSSSNDTVLDREVLHERLAAFCQELIDELLLVWHPVWEAPEPGSNSFALFALDPISPRASMGFLKGLFSGRGGRGLNGLVVTNIETTQPEFRWVSLEEMLAALGKSELITQVSDLAYEFRLYSAADAGIGLVPGQLLLEHTNIVQPLLHLPAPLESCQSYFWTVRARFQLGGFPRRTEWTSLHNASGGIIAPWRFRRGERVLNGFNPALTYAAFATPSSIGKIGCGR